MVIKLKGFSFLILHIRIVNEILESGKTIAGICKQTFFIIRNIETSMIDKEFGI